MLEKTCHKIVNLFLLKALIKQDEINWCVYALVSRASTILSIFLMIIIGAIIATPLQTICFLFGILTLRRRLGGYHAKTPATCAFLSVAVMIFGFLCVELAIFLCIEWVFWILLLSSSFLVLFANLQSINDLNFTNVHLYENSCRAKIILIFDLFLITSIQFFFSKTILALYFGFGVIAAFISFFVNKKMKNYNYENNS